MQISDQQITDQQININMHCHWQVHLSRETFLSRICSSYNLYKSRIYKFLDVVLLSSSFPARPTAPSWLQISSLRQSNEWNWIPTGWTMCIVWMFSSIKWLYVVCVVLVQFGVAFTATTQLHGCCFFVAEKQHGYASELASAIEFAVCW